MIPLAVGVLGVGMMTLNVMSNGATAGAGYAFGRKYGRKICHTLDKLETKVISSIDKFRN